MQLKNSEKHTTGIRVASSTKSTASGAARDVASAFSDIRPQHIVLFFSIDYDAAVLCETMRSAFPGVPISGCTTAGEITPDGLTESGLVAIAFPEHGFKIVSEVIEPLSLTSVDQASQVARKLRAELGLGATVDSCSNAFGILLVDGLSNSEEPIIAAINWALGDVQLIGGSAGDNLAFQNTVIVSNGRVVRNAGLLILAQTDVPFQTFKTHNFDPLDTKLVVTAADPEQRIVHELNAEPAAREYAAAIGLMADDLGPMSFASYPLVVKVGGDYYCRSIRNMNEDGSLSFFCAIDEGLVFTVARPVDILESTEAALRQVDAALNGIDVAIGFDCILRRLDAENRQVRRELSKIYGNFGVVGFQTYGEQFNAMHLNQTLTGIAFGAPPPLSHSIGGTLAPQSTFDK